MRILVVDDERNIRESLKKYLRLEGIEAEGSESGEEALALLERESFDAAVLDLRLPGMSGQQVLERLEALGIPTPVIMISAHGQIADAVAALKTGARDYLVKPFDPAELVIKLRALVAGRRNADRLEAVRRTSPAGALLGQTDVMRRLSERISRVAATDVTVLLTGESGTGKEVAAREIHTRGGFADEPFVAVNIGGIHESLMESELFGHEKGAFTGAAARKRGLFELAGRGVIFLDEVGEMPAPLQVKLLRVLQDKKVRRLGGTADIPVAARIISATNRDIEALVRDGRFREDLYYRLNVFRLTLPPLRERLADVPLLAESLLARLLSRMGRPPLRLSPAALGRLGGYSYPGNIRELENVLERAVIYAEGGLIKAEDIDFHRADGLVPTASPPSPSTADRPPDAFSMEEADRTAATAKGRPPTASTPLQPPAARPPDAFSMEEADRTAATAKGRFPTASPPSALTADRPPSAPPADRPPTAFSMEESAKKAILDALARHKGNRTKAAEELGISRKTIHNKLKGWGI